jgi:hypothetical protein
VKEGRQRKTNPSGSHSSIILKSQSHRIRRENGGYQRLEKEWGGRARE